ncbi:spore germination protein [Desulfosporosinus sp. OT]|uniref:spore germination protein n=1 Tax=Desulfosporosinus sp. OT TaxID=913865 RepID=UPI000223AF8A|nr:spore germination protein [Desulfosporosinus sp. OT]EGW36804.1 gerA spore germination family protein [Desulfosporosinus sp. OT]
MLKRLRKLRKLKKLPACGQPETENASRPPSNEPEAEMNLLTSLLTTNLTVLKERFQNSVDIVFREFKVGFDPNKSAALIYIDGLVNPESINATILKPLMFDHEREELWKELNQHDLLSFIRDYAVPNNRVQEFSQLQDITDNILRGNSALLLDGFNSALIFDSIGFDSRVIQEPATESVVRGPREGFNESLGTNLSLLRRKIINENLILEQLNLGTRTRTKVCFAYLNGVVNEKLVNEVRARLQRIDVDGILESGYIEQLIEDAPVSIFPTVGNTEKPDILAAKLLEGRIGILVDGTPIALTVPYILVEALQSSEDYYARPYYVTIVRWIRIASLMFALFLPAIYIAIQSFHPDLIPTPLLVSMAKAREGIPFPAYVEVFLMGMIFEILREAGIRMPRPIGQAVSIVGGLVIGEAASKANLVSDTVIIFVALTGIASFVIPSLGDAIPLSRLFLMTWATFLGIFGILMGSIILLIHLVKLRSFGVPYMAPLAPGNLNDLQDVLIKAPTWALNTRPRILAAWNSIRGRSSRPSPKKK